MMALDTNVLVRFLVEDDPQQTKRAKSVFKKAVEEKQNLFISDVVLCELMWVLRSCYRISKMEMVQIVRRLALTKQIILAPSDECGKALDCFETGRGDFADYLILQKALLAGCTSVVTFDESLLKESKFARP